MSKNTMKLGIIFEAPFDKLDKTSTTPAFAKLREQILDYAKALEKDPNVLIIDAFFITTPGDYATRATQAADPHIATLKAEQTENINKAATSAKKEAKEEAPGPVTAASPTKPAKKAKEAKVVAPVLKQKVEVEASVIKPVTRGFSGGFGGGKVSTSRDEEETEVAEEKAVAVATEDVDAVVNSIFEDLKRTEKSVTIITALAKAGKEVTIDELVASTKISKNDVSSWLAQTGKKVKAVENTGRGKYKLNFDKV